MSNTYSDISEISGKCRKRYVDYLNVKSKPTCLIRGSENASDECKVLGDFGSKYAGSRPTKDHGHYPANRKKFNKHQENNDIFNSAFYEILLQENQKGVFHKMHC